MDLFFTFTLTLIFIYLIIIWVCPKLLSWIFGLKYQVRVTIGYIRIPYLRLKDVNISRDGISMHIDELYLSSSLFNSEVSKLFAFIAHDVRFNKVDPLSQNKKIKMSIQEHVLYLQSIKLPSFLVTVGPFMSILLTNISAMWAGSSGWFIHTTADEIKLEGNSSTRSNGLGIKTLIKQAKTRICKRLSPNNANLAEICYTINSNMTLTKLCPDKLNISIETPRCVFNKCLFQYLKKDTKDVKLSLPNIPKTTALEVIDSDKSTTFDDDQEISLKFQQCKINARCTRNAEITEKLYYFVFQLESLNINSCRQNIFFINNLSLNAKVQNKTANLYLILNTINVNLNTKAWPNLDFIKESSPKKEQQNPLFDWNIQICVETWATTGTLSDESSIFCSHVKLILEHSELQWTAELLLESLGWSLSGQNNIDRRVHISGTPLYLAVALVKFSHSMYQGRIDAMLDKLRLEWNSTLMAMVRNQKRSGKSNKSLFSSLIPSNWGINVTFTDLNIFFLLENIAYIATRIDSVVVEGTENKIGVQTTGVKMQDLNVNCASYTCIRSSDIVNYCAYAEAACFDGFYLTNTIYEWKIKILEKITFNWSYLLHMKLVTIYRSFPKREKLNATSVQVIKKWSVWFNRMSFFAELLTHQLQLDGYEVCIKGPKFRLSSSCLNLFVNQAHVITANTLSLDQSDSNPEVCQERKGAEGLELTKNNAWIFKLALFEAHFPYKHNFADAIQNELVSTFKWLKIIHNKKKVPFTLDSPLPRDLLIKIDECLFEMSDDPFEVRLRDNYELLVDEYKESLKRFQMLGSKVEELRKTHLLLSAGKVEELYANLSTRNAEIYIQRSKKLSSVGPQRTRLLAWRILQLNVIALADLSYHGTERAVNFIQSVNPGSLFPTEGITFSTLWVRTIHVSLKQSTVSLRDFPQPFLEFRGFHTWGKLGGAEATPPPRSVRIVTIDLPAPWSSTVVERGMTQLKFYHDFDMEMEHYSYAFGPCWEPVIAQCNLSLERIFPPSRDPSPPLPFWDKMRLLLHGRLTMLVNHMTVLLHASLDPYNTTEEMELAWSDMALDWTEGKIIVRGDLDIYVRTASKYDDCRLLHLHNLKLTIKLNWVCLSDPNDHHSVIPCAPDKLPEYSSNQEHDSFRAFRSQNIDISISLEAKGQVGEGPSLLLYGSTLRWFESLQLILSGVTRPTRCGLVFGPLRPRRKPLSRHYRKVRILLALQQFQSSYWMSCAMQRGCELVGNRIVCSSEHCLALVPSNDGLIRRPKAVWSIAYMNCEVTDAEVWLKSALQTEQSDSEMPLPVEKFYCLSVEKVSYGRETPLAESRDTPTHRLVVYDLRGAWTKSNRDVAFALLDAYVKSQQLRKNLSAEALRNDGRQKNNDVTTNEPEVETKTSPEGVGQQLSPASMLQKLIAEAEHKPVVFSDDQSPAGTQTQLQGLQACKLDDVLHNNWLIALVNAQVVLRGCETKGYVILSAAKAEILQRVHGPAPKRTWVGSLECLQYYATVGAADDDIMWLPVELIQEHGAAGAAGPAAVVGSGRAAGGVVTQIVGAGGRQLQRIVSRCCCEFFYVSYGAADPSGPTSDAFTLMHHDLDICTNSLQYAMLLDVVNSLLLYVEPTRKEAAARLARLRFQLQLRADGSVRVPVQKLQTEVRTYLRRLRQLERDAHLVGESTAAVRIRQQLAEVKTDLAARAEELQMLLAIHRGSAPQTTVRSHEIYFKHAQWRLTDADGQLGIADLVLSNFLYTKNSKSDGSVEHLLELGYIHMTNLLPNQIYSEVLSPTEIQRDMPVDHKHVLRVFCRERPPVGGISVKEHFEVNVLPITIGLTKKFYNTMLKFCFPERDDPDAMQSKVSKDTSFYVRIDQKDDVEKMKERAEKNKLFIYIKIPEVPVRVSYKGNKEKNIEDVRDFSLVIPTLEYHNVTWTWLDLLLAMKNDTRRVILSQAIKQKLQLNRGKAGSVDQNSPQEADKVKMLFGKLSSIK